MTVEKVDTLVIGGGQAGLAASEHLTNNGVPHLVIERKRIAERWRSERWDTLVANGPAWHDRFPNMTFDMDPDGFASKDSIVSYFEAYAKQINASIRCGVEVTALSSKPDGSGFIAETSQGSIEARNVVAATGPFQKPVIPPVVPADSGITQIHSASYRNPGQLPEGGVLVIGAGSSGVQIADELARAGRKVYLAVGPHNRPPRSYRGKDFVWWLGALGLWNMETPDPSTEHVTIAVSGARGGHTVDFRDLAAQGITLVGRAESYANGTMHFAPDLAQNIAAGDADYLSVLDSADAHIEREGLDFPEEPEARIIGPEPDCVKDPILELDLAKAGITSIIWATGYALDFGWLQFDVMDERGRPAHQRGVSKVPGFYFLGLAWLSRRASPFIWGVWHDAKYIAEQIAAKAR
ncbi:MAG: NAD(P)/FAD-dependent oxidoreductase [Alphaproteobacteria bacterium]|nr:FAD-dependent oxidoreductase [Rhizobiaceae bacterium]MBU3959288.1 NAD(P)/FAD-dependent oxidoreductase [Alphaproteobacteria bacterium]MBU4049226.1 NAD(P)/FAD-dependent oxidoreductase [Alphaproteobacteria bacterium]MBU4091839.1 NAD(P)/FAD-dependent oxidoreductase [Alphaproteobacteria bacterium]MBU4156772.1 NAD(P)/FAD-dependent oxidoreductase [Alphaproteobacteria bacterium]